MERAHRLRSITCIGVAFAALLAAGSARAAYYTLIAGAGGASDVAVDEDDPSAVADYQNPDPVLAGSAFEVYQASADGSGSLAASAESSGFPPFAAISHRAVARIEETIELPTSPFPNGPVTVTVGMGATLVAGSELGSVANATAQVQLEPNSLSCSASDSANFGPAGSCPGGVVSGLSVTRTFTLQELSNRQWEIDIAGQVDANLDLFGAAGASSALATGGLYATVAGGGVESFTWTGTNTSIPAPEPVAASLGCAALASLAALRGRRG